MRLYAMQDVGTASTEPLAQPLAICKSWLLSVFPLLRNEELVSRVAWTVMIIAIARLGLYMKLPYLDPQVVPQASYKASKPPSCLVQNWHALTSLHVTIAVWNGKRQKVEGS